MKFSNLHQHSTFSDGKNTLEEVVLSAIEKGMESIGFSDHSYTSNDESYCMALSDYEKYCKQIDGLKQKYLGKVDVFKGIELDYYSTIDKSKFDYVIASVHYLKANDKYYPVDHSKEYQLSYINDACGGDLIKFASDYYSLLVKHVENCKPDIVGHFDVITKFSLIDESDERYREIAVTALKQILKTCNAIEMNTGAIIRKKRQTPYPAEFLLEEILKLGGEIVLSSDSHSKDTITDYFDDCIKTLKKIGFKYVLKFNGKSFYKEYL